MIGLNAAVMSSGGSRLLPLDAPGADIASHPVLAITESRHFQGLVNAGHSATFAMAGLDARPLDRRAIAGALQGLAARAGTGAVLAFDMNWRIGTAAASANFDIWGALCDDLVHDGLRIGSIYDWHLLTGDQILAALRGHPHFLAASGLHDNPFWLPNAYLVTARALLHRSADGRTAPIPGRTYPATFVTGMPSAV